MAKHEWDIYVWSSKIDFLIWISELMIFATETMEEILQIKYKSQLKTINFPLILRIQGFKGEVIVFYFKKC